MDHETSAAPGSIGALAAALLRTAAWLYGGLWVVTAATSPWGPPGTLAVALVAPLAPLVLLATLRRPVRRPPSPPHPARVTSSQ